MKVARLWMILLLVPVLGIFPEQSAEAYITFPVTTLGALLGDSTYITEVQVDKVNVEKGIIVYKVIRDLKGKYPKEKIRHVFDLKTTPAHKGSGDVPIRVNEADWRYALDWAKEGKTAIVATRKYDPFGDFGHTYIDGLWYATMCPPRDWEFWYAIYSDNALLGRWHCGSPHQLAAAVRAMAAGKDAIVPALADGSSKDDLRKDKAKIRGLKVGNAIRNFDAKRDLVTDLLDQSMAPALVTLLKKEGEGDRAAAARSLGLLGPKAKDAIAALADLVQNDASSVVRISAVDALIGIGPEAKIALPALEAALKDPRIAQNKDVIAKITEAVNGLK